MIGFELSIDKDAFRAELRALEVSESRKIELLLQSVGFEVVAYLRSLSGGEGEAARGPARTVRFNTREGTRVSFETNRSGPTHPGGWRDVTGNLALAYAFQVESNAAGATLIFTNHMEYAAALEARDGLWVLRGVTDPGGPLDRKLREVLPKVAPGWEIRG